MQTKIKRPLTATAIIAILFIGVLWINSRALPQQQVSGGGSVTIVQGGNAATVSAGGGLSQNLTQVNGTAVATGNGTVGAGVQRVSIASDNSAVPISGSIGNTAFGINGGVANIGIVRQVPSSCTQSTNFTNGTVGVATGAGTSVTSTTTCVTVVYVTNITNAAVTFRLQDKTGTPIIWVGGNADFIIPANSNVNFPLAGVQFTGGITAIAGTASALNLWVSGLQ